MMERFNKTKIANLSMYALALSIAVGSIVIGVALLYPIDVMKNWTIKLDKTSYTAGETTLVQSLYTKTSSYNGTAKRYIECKNVNNVYIRYPLNEAKADRASGKTPTGTGIPITMPIDIPNLPTTCVINISIDYKINALRTVNESQNSPSFQLTPVGQPTQPVTPQPTQSTQSTQTQKVQPTDSEPQTDIQPSNQAQTINNDYSTTNNEAPQAPKTCAVNLLGIKLGCK